MQIDKMIVTTIVLALTALLAAPGLYGHGDGHGERVRREAVHDTLQGDVPLYDDLGSHHHEITTDVPLAQRYFDQGLRWLFAFNHPESLRSFREAERLDPDCAMCAWGTALALGPNINAGMDSASGEEAYAAIRRALDVLDDESETERAFVRALATRYGPDPTAERAERDSAYARAMAKVAERYPENLDAQVLYADALMNLSPWNYWTEAGELRPDTDAILGRLRYAMKKDPKHPYACHLFIHAVEAVHPEWGIECAERLAALMPGAGHIVHMPGHIYIRIGRYADAVEANKHAVHADESYLEGPTAGRRNIYSQGYYPHNYHFMSFAASMAGDSETAIYAARRTAEKLDMEVARQEAWLEVITPIVPWTLVTFGRWDAILAEPLPPRDMRFTVGQVYYARGIAHAAKGDWAAARAALDTVSRVAANFPEGENRIALRIARHALAGEIAMRRGDLEAAIAEFRTAVKLEDSLAYLEPPTWYYPMRHSLGKALLEAGRAKQAEAVYRQDLERFPENGWSLYGLYQSLQSQGCEPEARQVKKRFEEAWQQADVTLSASRL